MLQNEVIEVQRLLGEEITIYDKDDSEVVKIEENKNTEKEIVHKVQNAIPAKDTSEDATKDAGMKFEEDTVKSTISCSPSDSTTMKNIGTKILELLHMTEVKGGTFMMGHKGRNNDFKHEVTLSGFYIGKFEVTQKLWCLVMDSNPSMYKGDMLPVDNISYDDIQVFLLKLRHLTGKKYRLPTEAEWEYAARGGRNSNIEYDYSGGNSISDVAWYDENANGKTHIVGTKVPNELGIYDMTGNVSEWCNDWFDEGYYNRSNKVDPQGPTSGITKVIRGGSFNYNKKNCKVSVRSNSVPSFRHVTYGFRLALSND